MKLSRADISLALRCRTPRSNTSKTTTTPTKDAGQIRKAHAHELPLVARTLARAFLDDPVFRWAYPDDDRRRAVLPGVIERIGGNGTRIVNLNIAAPSLEDVFIHLTGKALRD